MCVLLVYETGRYRSIKEERGGKGVAERVPRNFDEMACVGSVLTR